MMTNLSAKLVDYYEWRFFLRAYGGDEDLAKYEWDWFHSKDYKTLTKYANRVNTGNGINRSYRDKRTCGYKFYVSLLPAYRKRYEKKHPIPRRTSKKSRNSKAIVFTRTELTS